MALISLRSADPRPRVRERRYLFLCYLLDHFGRVDFSRNLEHVRRLNFTCGFIHGMCSVFISLKGTNCFHLQIIQPLLALPTDVSASRRHNEMGVETIFRPTHDANRKAKPTDFSRLALQHVPDDLNLFRFQIEVKAVVFNAVSLHNATTANALTSSAFAVMPFKFGL